ncbi:MAG: M48 family metalloprotease [Pseudomonadota bacterium]
MRYRSQLAATLLSSCIALASASADAYLRTPLPTLGDTDREILPPTAERKLGERIMRKIRRDNDYLDDAPILEYLNTFGTKLVEAHPEARGEAEFNYFFFAVRDPALNAFALPGGFIAAHSGLILAAQTESELAAVIAHEIGHVAQRHIARMLGKQSQDALLPLAGVLLAVLAARNSPDAASAAMMGGQGLALQRQLNFSRDAEREADRVGLQILQESNYDTSGMIAFFRRLQSASRMVDDVAPSFLLSHPLTTERIADIQVRLSDQRYRQRTDGLDFYLIQARARVLQAGSAQGLQEASAILKEQILQRDSPQAIAGQYGLALIALRQRAPDRAQALLEQARVLAKEKAGPVKTASDSMLFQHLAIDIKLAAGAPAAAVQEADAGRKQFPLSRGIALQYADALIAAGRTDDAINYLRSESQQYRTDAKVQDRLAKAYAAKGKMALQHIALAESYALNGETQPALDQLLIARRAKDASYYDQSVIDARERTLQALRREEIEEEKKAR